ncbi:uroporphyrinogen-III C-methyltransferase [Sugiyamaella lignohabitans]|uniref:Uroporphyrinogen-III C-methyltransferase n=1 Tax=Sugiyamaella lignohabitans TaxID=796027 RepID=A0A167FX84_9ASCO|nr:uroporphyrinogen-III C-methyltransferase [Sugiyamaella lignohabitans]ANB15818.1 uroporphyrinogen-III C-methyltransferase [Sugiyamaella lignohabitans]
MGILINHSVENTVALVVGDTPLAQSRYERLKSLGASPLLVSVADFEIKSILELGRQEVDNIVDSVYVATGEKDLNLARDIAAYCKKHRVPVNVADHPELCSFTLLSTYSEGDFQLGITTGGKGCRLANRIKRHVTKSLPPNVGEICKRVGELRYQIQAEDKVDISVGQHDDDADQAADFNKLVLESQAESIEEKKKQRIRWLSQIVEYYPFSKLATLDPSELSREYGRTQSVTDTEEESVRRGRISLVGSGPGSEDLLTKAALKEINTADIILADKLVPSQVLELIPRRTPVHIAKKFPGNAERAQEELLELGLEALEQGKHVVRLKQGDPYIFGRGAEEFIFFRDHGFTPTVIAGITSALAAPLYACISATHRNVADQLLVCTGTGRGGTLPDLPEWVASRTTVFLMSLHRIEQVVEALIKEKHWNENVPCAVVERASCPDQRIIRTRLKHVAEAIKANGSRPPGLLVTGFACDVITPYPQTDSEQKWLVSEGI